MLDRLLGAADQVHRREIGFLDGGAPADGPVLLEEQCLGRGVALEGLRHLARDEEARAPIRKGDDLRPVDLAEHIGRAVVVGEGHDGIGVGVDHRCRGQESVEECLDGRARARRLLQRMRQVVDHLLVAHVLPIEKSEDIVHAHAGEVLLLDALEIRARSLDAKHPHLATAVVTLGLLDRGIPAAPHHQRRLGADEPRSVHEETETVEIADRGVVPARVHGDTITETAGSLKAKAPLAGRATRRWRTGRSPPPPSA
jgi:hypothetical protein